MRWGPVGGPVCRPYGEQQALSRSGGRGNSLFPLSRCARHLPLIRGVVLPYDSQEYLLELGRGGPWASRQDTHRERWLKKPRRMSGTAPAAIFAPPGPSGPAGIQTSHSDFARRKFCKIRQVRVPRNGGSRGPTPLVKGRWPKARGDRDGRHGGRSGFADPADCARPLASSR